MGAWFDYITDILMGVLALLWLFEGSRRLVLHGAGKSTVVMLIGGLFLSVVLGGTAYFKHSVATDFIETINKPVFAKLVPLPDDWGGKCCKGTHESESRRLVHAAFVESGQLHSYFDSSGKRIPFSPTEKEIKEREERVVSNARVIDASRARLSEAMYALIAAILSAIVGAFMGYEQRKASANSTAESDARKNGARGSP
jgi:hypothetical protein